MQQKTADSLGSAFETGELGDQLERSVDRDEMMVPKPGESKSTHPGKHGDENHVDRPDVTRALYAKTARYPSYRPASSSNRASVSG